jgi:hypothetical protein
VELQGSHYTHDRSLPVSMRTTCDTAGVPMPTVTAYSRESTEVPKLVGTLKFPCSCVLRTLPLDNALPVM